MTVYIALLRGINVGGRTLPMDVLRAAAESRGFAGVRTYIQSGNVLFTSRKGAARVSSELHDAIVEHSGIDTEVVVRTGGDLRAVLDANPWPDRVADPTKVSVCFLFGSSRPSVDAVEASEYAPDEVAVVGAQAYLSTPNGMGRSNLTASLLRRLGIDGTTRNWRTTTVLAEMAEAMG